MAAPYLGHAQQRTALPADTSNTDVEKHRTKCRGAHNGLAAKCTVDNINQPRKRNTKDLLIIQVTPKAKVLVKRPLAQDAALDDKKTGKLATALTKARARRARRILDTALTKARARGARRVAEILAAPDMLPAGTFCNAIGLSLEDFRLKYLNHEILGLRYAEEGERFPSWQIGADGGLLPGLAELFERLGGNSWTVYRFLLQHHPELDGEAAVNSLKAGRVNKVLEAAESAGQAFS